MTQARFPATAQLSTGTWTVVATESTARFSVRDKMVTTVHGTIPVVSGTVEVSPTGEIVRGRMELDLTRIETGNRRRDLDLAKPSLLGTAAHPVLVVETGPAEVDGSIWRLPATLSAGGGGIALSLAGEVTASEAGRIRVRITGRLDRTGLGMRVPRFVIGRYIDVDVDAWYAEPPRRSMEA